MSLCRSCGGGSGEESLGFPAWAATSTSWSRISIWNMDGRTDYTLPCFIQCLKNFGSKFICQISRRSSEPKHRRDLGFSSALKSLLSLWSSASQVNCSTASAFTARYKKAWCRCHATDTASEASSLPLQRIQKEKKNGIRAKTRDCRWTVIMRTTGLQEVMSVNLHLIWEDCCIWEGEKFFFIFFFPPNS